MPWVLLVQYENGDIELCDSCKSKEEIESNYFNILTNSYDMTEKVEDLLNEIKDLNYKYLIVEIDEKHFDFQPEINFISNPKYLEKLKDLFNEK